MSSVFGVMSLRKHTVQRREKGAKANLRTTKIAFRLVCRNGLFRLGWGGHSHSLEGGDAAEAWTSKRRNDSCASEDKKDHTKHDQR